MYIYIFTFTVNQLWTVNVSQESTLYIYICVCTYIYMYMYIFVHIYIYIYCKSSVNGKCKSRVNFFLTFTVNVIKAHVNLQWRARLRLCGWQHTATHCNTLQHAATHCNILQHTATHCNILQHTATHCNTLQHTEIEWWVVKQGGFGESSIYKSFSSESELYIEVLLYNEGLVWDCVGDSTPRLEMMSSETRGIRRELCIEVLL